MNLAKGWSACVIAASGPSLCSADLDLVHASGLPLIVVNDAWRLAPWADVLYACDAAWWRHHAQALSAFKGERWTQDEAASQDFRLHRVRGRDGVGLCSEPGTVHFGRNGGFQALNLAWHFGARRIVLLGYDMQNTGGRTHFFGEHPMHLVRTNVFAGYIEHFERLAVDLRKHGVEVINATRETALACFHRKPLEMALLERMGCEAA